MKSIVIALFFLFIGFSFETDAAETPPTLTGKQTENYVPGMGEIMGSTQMRHSKLWFAGKSKNWTLASYELDEIKEGLDDAVKYYPVFKHDAPIAALLDKFTMQPLNELEKAIDRKDSSKFRIAFDRLTKACNGCHEAARQGFIVIKRPSYSPFSNQEFAAHKK